MLLFAEVAVGRTWFVELQSATSSLANPMLSIGVSLEVAGSAKKMGDQPFLSGLSEGS